MDDGACPLCGGDLNYNQTFYLCEACFTPFNPQELAAARQARARVETDAASGDVLAERAGAIGWVVLNRPERRNAISLAMWRRLALVFRELDADPAVRAVIVRGAGDKAFSAGADVTEFEQTRGTPEKARAYAEALEDACGALAGMAKPTIALVKGHCIGGGFELALSADLRIAGESASFALPAARMGLAIGHTFVSRIVGLAGWGRAAYLLLGARAVGGAEAAAWGLADMLMPDDEAPAYAEALAADAARLSPNSHRIHKQVLRDLLRYGAPDAAPPANRALPREAANSADFHEGVRAFLERRPPRFGG
ncbi:MAG: enoyl-CoA hydratase/isomerase family protein [Dehalococcoidia bacterium]|nr:enoyl-CoA hydratase/isomerase family protein [Dehalococcoidia bacterium]